MSKERWILKSKLIVTFVLLLSMFILTGCNQREKDYSYETTSFESSQTAHPDDSESEEVSYKTSTTKDRSKDDWKLAYTEYVRHGDGGNRSSGNYDVPWDEYTYFSLIDVDGDDIPELLRTGGFVAQGEALLTYANGKLVIIDSYASAYAFEGNSGYLWREERDRENDIEYYRYFKFNKGNMTLLKEAAEIDPTADRAAKYIWDGKEVSKSEFEQLRNNEIKAKANPKELTDDLLADDMILAINDY